MPDHISKQFDMELENIRTRVLQMGGLVEQQIRAAMEALQEGDVDRLDRVIADDAKVNAFEVAIDEDCQHIIARRQPAASDLRMVITDVAWGTVLTALSAWGGLAITKALFKV